MISKRFIVSLYYFFPFFFTPMGSLIVVTIGGILIALCLAALIFFSRGPTRSIKLRLRGLPVNSDLDEGIESTMNALTKKGLKDPGAHLLISRLNWYNQMNCWIETLPENKENLNKVVTSLEVLLRHQLDQSKVEKDLARVIFDKAIQDPTNAQLYARLCKRLMASKIDWSTNFIHRLFHLVVDEFNRPLVSKERSHQLKSNKTNSVKLMAALLKRNISTVPDGWITDFAYCLSQRIAGNLENSTEHLCLFMKTILINESDDDFNLSPTQQNQPSYPIINISDSETDTDSESESDSSDSE